MPVNARDFLRMGSALFIGRCDALFFPERPVPFCVETSLFRCPRNSSRHPFLLDTVASIKKLCQTSERSFPVAHLGATLGCLSDHPGGEMAHPHPGVGGVAVLPARSRATKKFEFKFRRIDIGLHGIPFEYAFCSRCGSAAPVGTIIALFHCEVNR